MGKKKGKAKLPGAFGDFASLEASLGDIAAGGLGVSKDAKAKAAKSMKQKARAKLFAAETVRDWATHAADKSRNMQHIPDDFLVQSGR